MEAENISEEQRKRLDRQRFIGVETQKRLLTSRALIINANGPNTQLAKNLALAGVNLTIYDDSIANDLDFEANFLIAPEQIGMKRGQVVHNKLKEMNPFGKNQWFDQNILTDLLPQEQIKKYSFLITSTTDSRMIQKWDSLSKQFNIPYYNMICCGIHAFAYISLGQNYTYQTICKKTKQVDKVFNIPGLKFKQCLSSKSLSKGKQNGFIASIIALFECQEKGINIDPFNLKEENKLSVVELAKQIWTDKNPKAYEEFLTQIVSQYGLQFCPTYSVIGSIVSQEIIKVVENQNQPAVNWLVYNSEEGYASVVKNTAQKVILQTKNGNSKT